MTASSSSRTALTKTIVIQVVIVAVLLGWLGIGLPGLRRERAADESSRREGRIQELIQSLVVEDPGRELPVPAASAPGYAHPQRLQSTPSVDEIKQAMGAADGFSGDFRGGVHLTWTGTSHKLEASFNNGRLYCLRAQDLHSGHGALVFESSLDWRPF